MREEAEGWSRVHKEDRELEQGVAALVGGRGINNTGCGVSGASISIVL